MDQELFFKYFQMNSQRFDLWLLLIKSKIDHNYTHQIPISAAERLEITLRILATGDSQQTVALARARAIAKQYAGAGAGAGARAKYELALRSEELRNGDVLASVGAQY